MRTNQPMFARHSGVPDILFASDGTQFTSDRTSATSSSLSWTRKGVRCCLHVQWPWKIIDDEGTREQVHISIFCWVGDYRTGSYQPEDWVTNEPVVVIRFVEEALSLYYAAGDSFLLTAQRESDRRTQEARAAYSSSRSEAIQKLSQLGYGSEVD